jgi:flagellar biosynthesis protein FliQ
MYKETLADRAAAFIIGCLVGLFVAWGAMTYQSIDSRPMLLGIVIGCGLVAAFAWNWLWDLIVALLNMLRQQW